MITREEFYEAIENKDFEKLMSFYKENLCFIEGLKGHIESVHEHQCYLKLKIENYLKDVDEKV